MILFHIISLWLHNGVGDTFILHQNRLLEKYHLIMNDNTERFENPTKTLLITASAYAASLASAAVYRIIQSIPKSKGMNQ